MPKKLLITEAAVNSEIVVPNGVLLQSPSWMTREGDTVIIDANALYEIEQVTNIQLKYVK